MFSYGFFTPPCGGYIVLRFFYLFLSHFCWAVFVVLGDYLLLFEYENASYFTSLRRRNSWLKRFCLRYLKFESPGKIRASSLDFTLRKGLCTVDLCEIFMTIIVILFSEIYNDTGFVRESGGFESRGSNTWYFIKWKYGMWYWMIQGIQWYCWKLIITTLVKWIQV